MRGEGAHEGGQHEAVFKETIRTYVLLTRRRTSWSRVRIELLLESLHNSLLPTRFTKSRQHQRYSSLPILMAAWHVSRYRDQYRI